MARWTDLATWVGPTVNCGDGDRDADEPGDRMIEHRGVVLHIAAGYYEGTISWQKNPDADVSSHFIVSKSGRIAQMVDTDIRAWAQRDGNSRWLSVENEGFLPDALTPAQVEANARILARAHQVYGVPLQIATSPDGRGLGHHSMGAESGANWGHSACPGPAIKAQKAAIVARAKEIIEGDDMPTPAEYAEAVWAHPLARQNDKPAPAGVLLANGFDRTISAQTAALKTEQIVTKLAEVNPDLSDDDLARIRAVVDEQLAAAGPGLAATLAPQLVTAVREELGDLDDERVTSAVDRGIRKVLGELDEPAEGQS